MNTDVVIIGAGVNGITTALVLQCLGYDTQIFSEKTFNSPSDTRSHPEFGSLYPAASIIPHSVYSDQLQSLFTLSQSLFFDLYKQSFPGLTFHKHFEIFEFDTDTPRYLDGMINSRTIDQLDPGTIPRRPQSATLYGWAFDGLFANWPLYFSALINCYEQNGGNIIQQKLKSEDIQDLRAPRIINCSGLGSPLLFEDPVDTQQISRGHILHKPGAPLIKDSDNNIISYNYTPKTSVYSDLNNEPCDVYCYPRKDGWILGGSRQSATLSDKNWDNKRSQISSYEIDNIPVPTQIIDLNSEILEYSYGIDLDYSNNLHVKVGYRYIRNRENGLRLDKEYEGDKTIYHNYGHGGAGVTLSWGCAIKLAKQITSKNISTMKSILLQKM